MSTYYSAIPAYGRDYKSKRAVLEAWESGKDFIVTRFDGASAYINIDDKPADMVLNIRYDRLTKVCVIK